jgi:DNA-binding response OmpR family regulator
MHIRTVEKCECRGVRLLMISSRNDMDPIRQMLVQPVVDCFHLEWYETVSEALDYLRGHRPDVVLLEPELSGGPAMKDLQRVRRVAHRAPVIVLLDPRHRHLGVRALKMGADDYLLKGCLDSYLLERALVRPLPKFDHAA